MGKGKNVGLGRLREAADLNVPGAPFSFAMFEGRPVKVSVKHRVVDDRIFDEVKAVAEALTPRRPTSPVWGCSKVGRKAQGLATLGQS